MLYAKHCKATKCMLHPHKPDFPMNRPGGGIGANKIERTEMKTTLNISNRWNSKLHIWPYRFGEFLCLWECRWTAPGERLDIQFSSSQFTATHEGRRLQLATIWPAWPTASSPAIRLQRCVVSRTIWSSEVGELRKGQDIQVKPWWFSLFQLLYNSVHVMFRSNPCESISLSHHTAHSICHSLSYIPCMYIYIYMCVYIYICICICNM